jgi:hypothetical protein
MKQLFLLMIIVLIFQGDLLAQDEQVPRTGEYSSSASVIELIGDVAARNYEPIMAVDEPIEWEIYVAGKYDPAKPPGLLVYISPSDSGQIRRDWKAVLDDSNLIWISANKSGNKVNPQKRMAYALLAPAVISQNYNIDHKRVYLTGFSGGGRVASTVATSFPQLFKGAIYICGVNFWKEMEPEILGRVKSNRFVFLSGTQDFNLQDTKRVFKQYKAAGIKQIDLQVVPHMGHKLPGKSDFAAALAFLDDLAED